MPFRWLAGWHVSPTILRSDCVTANGRDSNQRRRRCGAAMIGALLNVSRQRSDLGFGWRELWHCVCVMRVWVVLLLNGVCNLYTRREALTCAGMFGFALNMMFNWRHGAHGLTQCCV